MVIKTILSVLSLFVMLSCSMTGKKDIKQQPGMCAKLPMAADGIVRLSKIEVYPEYQRLHSGSFRETLQQHPFVSHRLCAFLSADFFEKPYIR